jgi:hypothetical protein
MVWCKVKGKAALAGEDLWSLGGRQDFLRKPLDNPDRG